MEQCDRLGWLIDWLVADDPSLATARAAGELEVPADMRERYRFYRALVNVRPPRAVDAAYLEMEDAFLQGELEARGAIGLEALRADPACATSDPGILLWQGDITRLAVDGIVNAANDQLLGCFAPCHGCIDNAIHTAAGVRLRLACNDLMRVQEGPEPCGRARITPGFNLPAGSVLHTVGPIVCGPVPTARNRADLASCYRSCLDLAAAHGLSSIAFCCISTGEFRFPQRAAARIAVDTVRGWRAEAQEARKPAPIVVFNVFKDADLGIYRELLGVAHG